MSDPNDEWKSPATYRAIDPEPISDLLAIVEMIPDFDLSEPQGDPGLYAALELAKAALANRHVWTGEAFPDPIAELRSALETFVQMDGQGHEISGGQWSAAVVMGRAALARFAPMEPATP